jgi:hypothetical protein
MSPEIPAGIRGAVLAVLAVPATLIALAVGLLWLLGLLCGKNRREYITGITQQAMSAIVGIFHGANAVANSGPLLGKPCD